MSDNTELMRETMYRAAITCGHSIDSEKIVLYRDPKNSGNALSQLADRLVEAALSSQQPTDEMKAAWLVGLYAREPKDWLPTSDNINALPNGIRKYIHDLETNVDPAGIIAQNTFLRDQVEGLQIMYRKAATPSQQQGEQTDAQAIRDATLEEVAVYFNKEHRELWTPQIVDEVRALNSQAPQTAAVQEPASMSSEPDIDAVCEAVAEALGEALDCTRTWSAWGVGTIGENDFVSVASDPERVAEIARAAISAMSVPATADDQQAQVWISVRDRLPSDETPVLVYFDVLDAIRIGELRWEHPGFEDSYESFRYWDDPQDDGQGWEWHEITHWCPLLAAPTALTPESKPMQEESETK